MLVRKAMLDETGFSSLSGSDIVVFRWLTDRLLLLSLEIY